MYCALGTADHKLSICGDWNVVAGYAFISYVREDSDRISELQRALEAAGVCVWLDKNDLWPGEDWRAKIRHAITGNALVFIACFSEASLARGKSYQNEELTLAIEQMRLRPPEDPWLIPVRLDECEIPDRDIGGGRTLASIHHADVFGERSSEGMTRLAEAVKRILGGRMAAPPAGVKAGPANLGRVPGVGNPWLVGDGIEVESLAALTGGRVVAGCADGRVLVWDLTIPDRPPLELGSHKFQVSALDVVADGRVISGGLDGWVQMWNPVIPGHPQVLWPGRTVDAGSPYPRHAGPAVESMAVLGDERVAVVKANGEVHLWSPESLGTWSQLRPSRTLALSVADLGEERLIIGCMDGRVLVWDLTVSPPPPSEFLFARRPPIRPPHHVPREEPPEEPPEEPSQADYGQYVELGHHDDFVRTVAALPGGRVVSGGDDGRVLLWNAAGSGYERAELGRHQGWVFAVIVLPDRRVVSGGKDGRVLVCGPARQCNELAQLGAWVTALAAVPLNQSESYLVAAPKGQGLWVWPVTTPGTRQPRL
jgi:WD40 repeat protein